MVIARSAVKAARLLKQRQAAAKIVRKSKQTLRKEVRSNNSYVASGRNEKTQGPRRFSQGSRTKQARRDSASSNRVQERMDEAEYAAHRNAGGERELETLTDWQRTEDGNSAFLRNLDIRSGSHPAFKAEHLRWQKLAYG